MQFNVTHATNVCVCVCVSYAFTILYPFCFSFFLKPYSTTPLIISYHPCSAVSCACGFTKAQPREGDNQGRILLVITPFWSNQNKSTNQPTAAHRDTPRLTATHRATHRHRDTPRLTAAHRDSPCECARYVYRTRQKGYSPPGARRRTCA